VFKYDRGRFLARKKDTEEHDDNGCQDSASRESSAPSSGHGITSA
jgi:hypothetical protein